jgi:hypothetical protein
MHNNRMFYGLFLALAIVVASAAGFATAQAQGNNQNDTTTLTSQLANLTNATTSPEQVKQMDVIGGTINGTMNATNASSAGGTNSTN